MGSDGGAIINNTFSHAGWLEITPLLQYFEGKLPYVRDVTVSGNTFAGDCGGATDSWQCVHCSPGDFCNSKCPPHNCSKCIDCAKDSPWAKNISVSHNHMMP